MSWPSVCLHSYCHPAALPVPLHLLLGSAGGLTPVPGAHRGSRCQCQPYAFLLHAGLGRSCFHHRYPGSTFMHVPQTHSSGPKNSFPLYLDNLVLGIRGWASLWRVEWTDGPSICSTPGSVNFDGSIIASLPSTLSCCLYAPGLAVGLDPEGYGNPDFCWLSIYDTLIWSFAGPVAFAVSVSTRKRFRVSRMRGSYRSPLGRAEASGAPGQGRNCLCSLVCSCPSPLPR